MSDEDTTSQKETRYRTPKELTPREMLFAKLIAEQNIGGVEAARIAFQWVCEPNSPENQKARDLARAPRIKNFIAQMQGQSVREEQAKIDLKQEIGDLNRGKLRDYAFKQLTSLRDNPLAKAQVRYNAIKMLQKLHDPGKDINLIWRWMDLAWRYQTVHCPSCHKSYPLAKVHNPKLDAWRESAGEEPLDHHLKTKFDQIMQLVKRADKRRVPHKSQIELLSAPERHLVGKGGARAGKSYILAIFAALAFGLPGVEIWIIGEAYDRTVGEVEFVKKFLKSIFHPNFEAFVKVMEDKKTGEVSFLSKWGSIIKIKSAKAKGSITARPLELAICAEPGWLPADLYEELRARMSERLGRIIAIGTPKGMGTFVGRMMNMTGRDPTTNKVIRWKPADRLIANGAPWGVSLRVVNVRPEDNPEYVKSELESARMELTDAEYASEFEGVGVTEEGLKFANVKEHHLKRVDETFFNRASFVLGIDQGPKNFGVCLTAFDGDLIVPCWEYFNSDNTTMKRNLARLRARVPNWIHSLGGEPSSWMLTITDVDPPLYGAFEELEEEGLLWPTEITTRHKNVLKAGDNWRKENQEFVNGIAKLNKLIFHLRDDMEYNEDEYPGGYSIHDQVMQVVDKPEDPDKEGRASNDKGWQVSDPWRGDHVLDAWYYTVWAIFTQQVGMPQSHNRRIDSADPWAEQKAAFEYSRERTEQRELNGYVTPRTDRESREHYFGSAASSYGGMLRPIGHYRDEG
jgi:hypothetical protein